MNDGGISKDILDKAASQMDVEIPENRAQVVVNSEHQTGGGGNSQQKFSRVFTKTATKETEEGRAIVWRMVG